MVSVKLAKNEDFINAFRELERVIRDNFQKSSENTSSVAFYETLISKDNTDMSNYLTHLRQKRNIITHNATYTDNVAVTDFDIEFLNDIIYKINAQNGIVKDFYKPFKSLPAVFDTDAVKAICEVCKAAKKPIDSVFVLNADKTKIGIINLSDVFGEIAAGKKLTSKISTLQGIADIPYSVDVSTPMSDIKDKRPVPVTSRKKLVGLLY